jgi:hypothetical protein
MLVELFARNYATLNGLINGVNGTFQYLFKNIDINNFLQSKNWN